MVNEVRPEAAERALALSYAPADAREGLAALLALDETLAAIPRTTREPIVGQVRLTWWHGALVALDSAPPPAQPVLEALARTVLPKVTGVALAAMVEGWEALLDEPLDEAAMVRFARGRGAGLFGAAAAVLGGEHPRLEQAGEGWALADLAEHLRDGGKAALARELAEARLGSVLRPRWPVRLRSLGALALLARQGSPGSPRRVGRLLWHRLTGA